MSDVLQKRKKIYNIKNKELKELREELNENKPVMEQMHELMQEITSVIDSIYIDKFYSCEAIEYLVSIVEKQDYNVYTIPLTLYGNSKSLFCKRKYTLTFMTTDEEKAIEEINNKFSKVITTDEEYEIQEKYLKEKSDNYIQIDVSNNSSKNLISYVENNSDYNKSDTKASYSNIVDEKYKYIIGYMNEVANYSLANLSKVSLDELYIIADLYIKELRGGNHERSKCKTKSNKNN